MQGKLFASRLSATLFIIAALAAKATLAAPLSCEVQYTIQSQWGWGFVADVTVTNHGATAIAGYSLSWQFAADGTFHSGWNATFSQSGNTITASNIAKSWNGTIAANGGHVNFGFLGQHSGSVGAHPVFTLNGVVCNDTKAPSSAFTFWPQTAAAFETVRFYGLASNDTQNDIIDYRWNFGDGVTASGANVTHAFSSTGNHTVTLTTTDAAGNVGVHAQTMAIPLGSAGPVELANIGWEDGTTGGWYSGSASGTLSNSVEQAFGGTHSLRWDVNTTGADYLDIKIDAGALAPPGSKVLYRVRVPAGAAISWIQPYLMPHTPDWSSVVWHGDWRAGSSLQGDAWNEFSLILGNNFDASYEQQIGIQMQTSDAAQFTLYVDSIDWEEGPVPPRASFDYAPAQPLPAASVVFDATGSTSPALVASDRDGTIASYHWDFGDGSTASGAMASHAFAAAGRYNVVLTVTDSDGLINSLTRVVWVGQAQAAFAPPLSIVGTDIVDANGYTFVPRGVAMIDTNNWQRADFEYLQKEYKINMVRMILIPQRWYYVSESAREAYLAQIDNMLAWTRELGVYVSFDGWHEGGAGNEVDEWPAIQDAWNILAARYATQDHIIWETFNEPHYSTWAEWALKAETIIDIIQSHNPVAHAFGVPAVIWAQELDVRARPVNRPQVAYLVHPYPHVYSQQWTAPVWDQHFGYVALEGYGPVMNTEWSYPLFNAGDRSYGEALLDYMGMRGFGHLHWIYGGWGGPAPSDPNALRIDAWQLIWEDFNGVR